MNRAFSLVELSIVLVILGLITGGILAGQSLIRAAEMRSVTTEFENYNRAVEIFRDKYEDLPGDMSNATDIWGAADPTPATCATTLSTGVETCNGNGNRRVSSTTPSHESYRFWQHLANAELISGSFNGVSDTVAHSYGSDIGTNSPETKIDGASWFVWNWYTYDGVGAGSVLPAIPEYGNLLLFGKDTVGGFPNNAVMTPKELWKIDSKIDDGKPGRGKLTAYRYGECTGAGSMSNLDIDYDLSNTSDACNPMFVTLWK